MDTAEVLVALNDPKRKDDVIQEVLKHVRTIKDENGEKQEMVNVGGLYLDAKLFRYPVRVLKDTKSTPLRDDDILLAASPKTGSHWLTNILTFLKTTGPLDDIPTVQIRNIDFGIDKELDAVPSPRILQTHMLPQLLPRDAFKKGRKIVLVFRNPKDAAVSLFHFLKSDCAGWNDLKISWDCFIEHWIKESWLFYNFFDYYTEWQSFLRANKNVSVHVVYFENLRKNGLGEIKKLQKYLGLKHSDERLKQVLEKCSLKNLKAEVMERKCVSPFFVEAVHTRLYRKGEVGDWKTKFTVAQSEQMDAVIAEKFKGSIFREHALQQTL